MLDVSGIHSDLHKYMNKMTWEPSSLHSLQKKYWQRELKRWVTQPSGKLSNFFKFEFEDFSSTVSSVFKVPIHFIRHKLISRLPSEEEPATEGKTEAKHNSAQDKWLVVNHLQATRQYKRLISIARLFVLCGSNFTLTDVSVATAIAQPFPV